MNIKHKRVSIKGQNVTILDFSEIEDYVVIQNLNHSYISDGIVKTDLDSIINLIEKNNIVVDFDAKKSMDVAVLERTIDKTIQDGSLLLELIEEIDKVDVEKNSESLYYDRINILLSRYAK